MGIEMKRDPVRASVLATKIIPNVSPELARELKLAPDQKSLALITADCDDVTYTALDEATKKAVVSVVYAKSFYGGAANANTKLAGEVIGILAGPNPAEVKSGLEAAVDTIEREAYFVSANEDDSIAYYAHCISRTGTYLSESAGIREGEALAYLIAPPLEAMYGIDAALKAADVTLCVLYAPPSETNFGGALLTGSQSACKAACEAFAAAVEFVAENPRV
ncbi:microcompartment protein EutL [Anaerocolumna cellulosilytica]|uniref:Microcompartment protein EutL n=2 Tax=Anaerocolumna cellulosilytica TaxID=433286 RepID=A0A6S6R0X0_9FIRM|nr:microcompartment protein EutL [Anaerocolumna cellulosilytica]